MQQEPVIPGTPPPPSPSRRGVWLGLGIGAAVLCLVCALAAAGIAVFGKDLPGFSSLFATATPGPTPTPVPSPTPFTRTYDNPVMGLRLEYPLTWIFQEQGDAETGFATVFASPQVLLSGSTDLPRAGAAFVAMTNLYESDLGILIDRADIAGSVDTIASLLFSGGEGGRDLRNFTLSGYPAGAGRYTMTDAAEAVTAIYMVTVLRETDLVVFLGACPESEWTEHQPTFEAILASIQLTPLP